MNNSPEIMKHYETCWRNKANMISFDKGPMLAAFKDFTILEFSPTIERKFWTYATAGMSDKINAKLELHIFSLERDRSIVELLTAVAYYHLTSDDKLNLWHTVNFGRPWQKRSDCQFGLISLPYLDGPILENFEITNTSVIKFYWLIPITAQEREYKIKYGLEALEERFKRNNFNYLNPLRKSVV